MRKSVRPVAVWPSNGAAYPPRARSYPDSVNLRSSYKRHFSNQSCRSHQPITRHGKHTAIFSSRIDPLRKFDQLLKIGDGTRQFSASTPKRNDDFDDFEEEDEDDFTSSSSDMSRMVRLRGKIAEAKARRKREQEQASMRRREELQTWADRHANELQTASVLLQNLKQNFEAKRQQRRAHEKWMRRYEQVITSSESSVNVASQSFEECFLIKYPEFGVIEPYINDYAIFIQHGEAEVSNCCQALRRIGLASRRIDLEMQLAHFTASLGLIVERLSDNHVTPHASAKRNIEEMLQPLHSFHFHYSRIQELGQKLESEKNEISSLIAQIAAKNPKDKSRLYKSQQLIYDGTLELTTILHQWRRMKRLSRWRDPQGGSGILALLQSHYDHNAIRMLASNMEINSERLVSELNTHGIQSLLAHWYLHRWKEGAPRSVNLDIAWRQLDIYHPFDMYYVSFRRVNAEVMRLIDILYRIGDFKSIDYLKGWRYRFVVMRSNILKDIEEMSYYTWIRLKTEDKVSRLGGVPDTIAKGLFTPKDPLSSDLRRFFLHIDAFGDRLTQCINLDNVIARFGGLRDSTTEGEMREYMDYSPSSKPKALDGFRTAPPIRVTTPPRRTYCTDSRACMKGNGQQCGVSESELALIKKDWIVQLENKDAAISLVSDAEPPSIMSSHVLLDHSHGPPTVATDDTKPQFWSYNQYKTPDGRNIGIHYCKNLEHAERAAALFSDSKLLGFDIEWKPQAQVSAGIKSNVSLIQIANEERIALFHIALFKGNEIRDLVPPSLKQLLESTDTVKVGVSIKADCSRVRRHLDIDTQGQFELSHLYKLVKYGSTQPKLVNRRAVNLALQVEELLGQPLRKDDDVRKSDWTKPLDYEQVQCEFPYYRASYHNTDSFEI